MQAQEAELGMLFQVLLCPNLFVPAGLIGGAQISGQIECRAL